MDSALFIRRETSDLRKRWMHLIWRVMGNQSRVLNKTDSKMASR
jgi:hypothetical protein